MGDKQCPRQRKKKMCVCTQAHTLPYKILRDFPDSPVVKSLSMQGVWVRYLAGELRSHMLCGVAKKIYILKKC